MHRNVPTFDPRGRGDGMPLAWGSFVLPPRIRRATIDAMPSALSAET